MIFIIETLKINNLSNINILTINIDFAINVLGNIIQDFPLVCVLYKDLKQFRI